MPGIYFGTDQFFLELLLLPLDKHRPCGSVDGGGLKIFGIAIHPCIENGLINEWNDAGLFLFFSLSLS